ncbi:MAG: glycosyltransferase [Chitinophagaceae bacterium]
MIKALWLTSWYPNKLDAMNGDFIQRHARAVSLFAKVTVIHAEPDFHHTMKGEISTSEEGNLKETFLYYPVSQGFSFISKIITGMRYKKMMKVQVKKYILENGLPDIVHVHVPMKAGIIALWLKKKYTIPFVVTEHWAIYNDEARDKFSGRNFIFKSYTKKILVKCSLFLPVSDHLGKAVNEIVTKVAYKPVPNVADTDLFFYKKKEEGDNKIFTFIHVSTMKFQKNPRGIVHAFSLFVKEYLSSKLIMVGENFDLVEAYSNELGIPSENIEFTDLLSYPEVAEKMQTADACILYSRFENLPCVIIEALCCGLPVISTDVGGISELINETNGILIKSEDENALLDSMKKIYSSYSNIDREKISMDAISKYNYETIGQEICGIYEEVIKASTKRSSGTP